LGRSNGKIVYRLVADLIKGGAENDEIAFSPPVSEALRQLKKFNYERIYLNPAIKQGLELIEACYRRLFAQYLDDLARDRPSSPFFAEFLASQSPDYRETTPPAAIARDFIAGMTDDYFLRQAASCGCRLPAIR